MKRTGKGGGESVVNLVYEDVLNIFLHIWLIFHLQSVLALKRDKDGKIYIASQRI